MAGGVCAPLLRISSAERRRLVLYRIAKMRKEKEMRQSNMEPTPHSYKKTFSLEDHKLHIEIERIEMQRRQAIYFRFSFPFFNISVSYKPEECLHFLSAREGLEKPW